jgi:zinc and cadmium transporter
MISSAFFYSLIWNIIIAFWIILIIFFAKFIKDKLIKFLDYITAITVGLLLGIIFLGFLPKLTTKWNLVWLELWVYILIWIFFFYLLELFLHWHHCKDLNHEQSCHSSHSHEHKNWVLMFIWTLFHNSFHWIVLFSAFSVWINFWIVTTTAVLLHSIPQNIVNYIMNHNNIKYAYVAGLWWILWAIITYPFSDFLIINKFYFLAIISWGLLYTALADIFPEFKWKWDKIKKLSYFFFILFWIFLFLIFERIII